VKISDGGEIGESGWRKSAAQKSRRNSETGEITKAAKKTAARRSIGLWLKLFVKAIEEAVMKLSSEVNPTLKARNGQRGGARMVERVC